MSATLCHICMHPLSGNASVSERSRIVCYRCNSKNETLARRAEDRYFRELREAFEGAARVWAENTIRREAWPNQKAT